jgi:hypothetical protein
MTRIENAKTEMYAAVKAVIDAHNAAWTGNVPFSSAVDKFSSLLESLDGKVALQSTKSEGATSSKDALRDTLEAQTMHIVDTLVLHFKLAKNEQEVRDVYITRHPLSKMSERAFIGHVSKVIAKAAGITAATLTGLGLDAAELTAASNNLNSFITSVGTPRHIQAESVRGTQELKAIINDIDDVLTEEMDPAANVLQYSKPEFFSEYQTAREIEDAATRTRELTVKVTDAEGKGLKGVKAHIPEGDIHKVTGSTGVFYINNMEGGTYTVVLTANGYQAKTIPFTIIDNQATVVNVTMAAN